MRVHTLVARLLPAKAEYWRPWNLRGGRRSAQPRDTRLLRRPEHAGSGMQGGLGPLPPGGRPAGPGAARRPPGAQIRGPQRGHTCCSRRPG